MSRSQQAIILRNSIKFWNRVRAEEFKPANKNEFLCPGWNNYQTEVWRPMSVGPHRIPGLPKWAGRRNEYLEFPTKTTKGLKSDKIIAFFFNGKGLQTSKIDENKNL